MSLTNFHWGLCGGKCSLNNRIKDHNGRDHTLQLWKYSIEKLHKNTNTIDFNIIDKNKQKQKIAEALWIKDLGPTLNTQEKSIQLKLFNWLWQQIITLDILNNISLRVIVIMIHRTIDTVNCIWVITIVTRGSLLLYFVNNNFINVFII